MSEGRYVLRVIMRLVSARLIYRILVAVSVIFISNYLITEPALADIFDLSSSIVSIVMIASEVGMSMILMKAHAQQSKEQFGRFYGTALTIETMAWGIIFVVLAGGYALWNGFDTMFWLLSILALNQAAIQYRVPIRSLYRTQRSHERITYLEVVDGASKLLGILYITATVEHLTTGAYWIAAWYTGTTILFIAIYLLFSFKLVRPQFDRTLIAGMVRDGVWFALQAIIMTVYFEMDKWVLRGYQTAGLDTIAAGDIARYGAASRVIIFFLVFHRIGLQVITPYLYETYPAQLERFQRIVAWSTRYMSAMGILIGTLIFVQAELIMHLLYKPEFWNAIPALRLFALFLIIRFIGITSSQIFATTGNQPLRTKQEGVAVVGNVGLDLAFMPWFSFLGGAIATCITEVVSQGVFYYISRRLIKVQILHSFKAILPAVMSGLLVGLTLWFSRDWWQSFATTKPSIGMTGLTVSAIGTLLYLLLLILFRFFNAGDKQLLKGRKVQSSEPDLAASGVMD